MSHWIDMKNTKWSPLYKETLFCLLYWGPCKTEVFLWFVDSILTYYFNPLQELSHLISEKMQNMHHSVLYLFLSTTSTSSTWYVNSSLKKTVSNSLSLPKKQTVKVMSPSEQKTVSLWFSKKLHAFLPLFFPPTNKSWESIYNSWLFASLEERAVAPFRAKCEYTLTIGQTVCVCKN